MVDRHVARRPGRASGHPQDLERLGRPVVSNSGYCSMISAPSISRSNCSTEPSANR
jgi:hypothetical protein